MRDRQWEAGQSSPGPQVGPTLIGPWSTDGRQPEGIVEMAFPEAAQLLRS
jgi:hypothetical protein